jgi:hypothetical protein
MARLRIFTRQHRKSKAKVHTGKEFDHIVRVFEGFSAVRSDDTGFGIK